MLDPNNLTSNNDLLLSSSNSNISSLSTVFKKKRNDISRKTLVIAIAVFLIISIIIISFVVSLATKAAKEQNEINELQNEIVVLNNKVSSLEDDVDNKYSNTNLDESSLSKTNGRIITPYENNDISIAYNTNIEDFNSFLSVIVNVFNNFWNFLN